jgi:hypothetical protein
LYFSRNWLSSYFLFLDSLAIVPLRTIKKLIIATRTKGKASKKEDSIITKIEIAAKQIKDIQAANNIHQGILPPDSVLIALPVTTPHTNASHIVWASPNSEE